MAKRTWKRLPANAGLSLFLVALEALHQRPGGLPPVPIPIPTVPRADKATGSCRLKAALDLQCQAWPRCTAPLESSAGMDPDLPPD